MKERKADQAQERFEKEFEFKQEEASKGHEEFAQKLLFDMEQAANRTKNKKEEDYYNKNEPKLMDIADNQKNLELEDARYARMEELFKTGKFPSAFTSALFTKEGQLRPIASTFLSPEAQEAVKLIVDSTSNIKDTYGARVTNFDLQTYLKKLPSLINTPEGRERVLRDLRTINQINQLHNKGILEIFEENGGVDKIPFSTAERMFEKKYRKQIDEMKQEFINPSKSKFNALPDPSKFLGRKIKNDKTGEVFISDGKEWKPEGKNQ